MFKLEFRETPKRLPTPGTAPGGAAAGGRGRGAGASVEQDAVRFFLSGFRRASRFGGPSGGFRASWASWALLVATAGSARIEPGVDF